jgi:hypothetical protein
MYIFKYNLVALLFNSAIETISSTISVPVDKLIYGSSPSDYDPNLTGGNISSIKASKSSS